MGKLQGKIALVTGGNGGIGMATAKQFVNEGAYVFVTGRRDAELAAAVKNIGRNVAGIQGDVSDLGDLDRLFAQIKREKGRLDIVFANAGVAKICAARLDNRGTLRLDLQHQCEGTALHRAEGAAADAGRRRDHPQCVDRRQQRLGRRTASIAPQRPPCVRSRGRGRRT